MLILWKRLSILFFILRFIGQKRYIIQPIITAIMDINIIIQYGKCDFLDDVWNGALPIGFCVGAIDGVLPYIRMDGVDGLLRLVCVGCFVVGDSDGDLIGDNVGSLVVGDFVGGVGCIVVGLMEGDMVDLDGVELGILEGNTVGNNVGMLVGLFVGWSVGISVGVCVGFIVGSIVGDDDGMPVGVSDGLVVGVNDGIVVGVDVGYFEGDIVINVGESVGVSVGVCVG